MKTMTFAGAVLALAVAGCTMTGPSSWSHNSQPSRPTQTSPAVYHQTDFGEPNNMPFDGAYTAGW